MSAALDRVTRLAELMLQLERDAEAAAAALAFLKGELNRVTLEDMPELMREVELTAVEMLDGTRIEVREDVSCGISEERRADAHEWLRKNGFGGLIKTEVTVVFDRDEVELAEQTAADLSEQLERPVGVDERVHPATLKAFIKEQLATPGDEPLPFPLFGIFPYSVAKIIPPKAPKAKKAKKAK